MLNPVAACSLCSSSISLDTYKAFAQVLERSEGQRIEGEHKIDCDKQAASNTVYPKLKYDVSQARRSARASCLFRKLPWAQLESNRNAPGSEHSPG